MTTMLMVPVLLLTTLFVRQRVRRAYAATRERISELNGFLHEQVSGMPVVQLFAQESNRAQSFADINDGVQKNQLRSVRWETLLSAATEMLAFYTTALILWYGGGLAADDAIELGTLLAFVQYMGQFFMPLNDLSLKYTVMQSALVASERIFDLLDEPAEVADADPPAPVGGDGSIEFRDVTFGYDPRRPVLHGLSFRANAGESIAVVGATGAGKTTILSLITRLYERQGGEILLDGVDIRRYARADLRRTVGVVHQDVFLFQGTILDNIMLGQAGVTEAEAIDAADILHLDEIVARFPGGYREPLAERGKNLSSGEKQLIAFARMLVVAPRVLALDEATSNVDSHTEHLLQEAVQRLMAGRTCIIIAHRLSTVRHVDRILVMHEGRLVESGSHDELLALDGAYRRLYQLQYQDQEEQDQK
jgi:ATP-binding cassette subfamily B protein